MTWDTYTIKCIYCGGEFKTTGKELINNSNDKYVITKTGNRYILHSTEQRLSDANTTYEGSEDSILSKSDLAEHLADGYHKLECEECKDA